MRTSAKSVNGSMKSARRHLERARPNPKRRRKATGKEPEDWVRGTEAPGILSKRTKKEPNPNPAPPHPPQPDHAKGRSSRKSRSFGRQCRRSCRWVRRGKRRRPQGGFRVEYKRLGKEGERSVYDPTTLTILINLDHPLVAAALGDGNVEDTTFRRLSYEIAFSEYAMGLGYEVSPTGPQHGTG